MAQEAKEQRTLLSPELTQVKRVMLAQTVMTPGWKVIIEILNDACARATQDTIKLDPEKPDYERLVVERQRRARNFSEFSALFVDSVSAHAESIRRINAAEDEEATASVGAMFGIHPVKNSDPEKAISNIFGIHPAKPKKKSSKEAK